MEEVAARLAVANAEGGEFSPPFFIRETPIPKAKSGREPRRMPGDAGRSV